VNTKNFLKFDWILFLTVFLLISLGMVALYSVSSVGEKLNLENFRKQFISISIGTALMLFFSFHDYRTFNSYSTKLYFGVVAILTAVIFFGTTIRGTSGWIGLGKYNFQPVEIVKIILVVFLASFLSKKRTELSIFLKVISSAVLIFIPFFLILKQPDFGSASIIIITWIAMLFVSGLNKKTMALLLIVGIAGFSLSFLFMKDYQKQRIVNFVNPYNDPQGSGYNVLQSIVAVGSGGIWGKGLGHGSQSQLNFLPEKHTDFIFAVITEEMGFIGAMVVVALFAVILYRIKKTAQLARDNFGYLISIGVMAILSYQIFINIGMNIGISPVAGVPLPFLSYGGSSLISMMASIGIIQSIYSKKIKTID